MASYKDLLVWQKAHALAIGVVKMGIEIRSAGLSGIRSQLTRSALSIPTNIVEGKGQKSTKDFIRFLGYSISSSNELEYHLRVCYDLGLIESEQFERHTDETVEVRKMLNGLVNHLRGQI